MMVNIVTFSVAFFCWLSEMSAARIPNQSIVNIVKRSTDSTTSPCMLIDDASPVNPADFPTIINELETQAIGLNRSADAIQKHLKEGDGGVDGPFITDSVTLGYLSVSYFIGADNATFTEQAKEKAISDPVTALYEQAALIDHLIVHTEAARTSSVLEPDARRVVEKLTTLERNYYSIMCQLKIALRAKGSDLPQIGAVPLSNDFQGLEASYSYQLYRIFILMNDSLKVSNYLINIYRSIATSL